MSEDAAAGTGAPVQGTTQGERRWRTAFSSGLSSPSAQGVVALAIYTAAWALSAAFPLVAHLGRPQLGPSSVDPNFYVWSLRWWPYAVAHGLDPLHVTIIGAPSGYDLAWTNSVPGLGLLFAPLTLATSPVVTFNVLVVLSLPLSAWAAFVLCRRVTRRFWPAFVGGAVYGFSAFEMNHIIAGQLNLAVSFVFPLMAYLAVRWLEGSLDPRLLVVLLAGGMLLEFLTSLELFADMTAMLIAATGLGIAMAPRASRRRIVRLAVLAGLAYLLVIVLLSPYIGYAIAHVPPRFAHFSQHATSADLAGTVVPRAGHAFGIGWLARAAGRLSIRARDGYMGLPLVGLVALFGWKNRSRRITWFLLALLAVAVVASFGPTLYVEGRARVGLPWGGLWRLPLARNAFPARLMVFAFLDLSVIAALWLSARTRRAWARWGVAALVLASIAVNTPGLTISGHSESPAFFATDTWRRVLPRDATVLVVPDVGNVGMLWQTDTDMAVRLVGGFVGVGLTPHFGQPGPVSDVYRRRITKPLAGKFRSFLRRSSVDAILVDPNRPGRWPEILWELGYPGRWVAGVLVYRT